MAADRLQRSEETGRREYFKLPSGTSTKNRVFQFFTTV
jgi:hypothetical protein